jgi:acyl-CoA reductase-like NAD-dependent aldehyde dehydrogenase
VKALVETASKALELADKLKQERAGTATAREIAEFGGKLLDRIEQARRRDIDGVIKAAVEAACQAAGITNAADVANVVKAAAAEVRLRVKDDGEIDLPQETGPSEAR